MALQVYTFNPLHDARWHEFLLRHPAASVFHTTGWLGALQRTYGYEPVVYTTSAPGVQLTNGIVLCRIRSWLTGRRMVSLPFADHCEPLTEDSEGYYQLLRGLDAACHLEGLNYVELRPVRADLAAAAPLKMGESFWLHTLDLGGSPEDLFRGCHKDSIQRKIRRAEREPLGYDEGRSGEHLTTFYRLLLKTRRRHGLPPQPSEWFRNLVRCLGNSITIHLASYQQSPIAAILTLRHRDTLVYKYGCSDPCYHRLGAMPFLFWKMIQEAKSRALRTIDFGRSDTANGGLIRFKDQFGTARSSLVYGRIGVQAATAVGNGCAFQLARRAFARMPEPMLTVAGRLLYRHIA